MTFSITARCERTGQFGVAVSTKVPAVGTLCPYAKAKVGAVATQSFVNPYIGINGIRYLGEGLSANEVLARVLDEDPAPELRQVCIVDKEGRVAAFTGEKCDTWNGHITGENFGVAGNMLVGEETLQAMANSFENTKDLSLAERLLQALEAGQEAGGDKRGRQSAAMLVVDEEEYPLVELRVDEHTDPVKELRRVYTVANKELIPLMEMLPTIKNPAGKFDFEYSRKVGLLQDNK
jgi:uncharacterized Ntn-hydrolase superfamily protein